MSIVLSGAEPVSPARCSYHRERRVVYMQISAVVGVVCADVCSLYGTSLPSGAFDHDWAELRKVVGWYAEELMINAVQWRGFPLPNPREARAATRPIPCEQSVEVCSW